MKDDTQNLKVVRPMFVKGDSDRYIKIFEDLGFTRCNYYIMQFEPKL